MSQLFIVIQNIYCSSAIKVKQRIEYFVSNKSCVYNLKLIFYFLSPGFGACVCAEAS